MLKSKETIEQVLKNEQSKTPDFYGQGLFSENLLQMVNHKKTKALKVRSVTLRDNKLISGAIVRINSASTFTTKTSFLNFFLLQNAHYLKKTCIFVVIAIKIFYSY
ncbi:hypothetical protein UP15_06025 [Bacillus pumilus]|nr:hypothetical protein UP15_06025 [Bacillus pumilus]KQL47770.1 hypothetical protein AN962_02865 [Bacillus sp. FJAT-21955]PJI12828.1 hypothetical protein CTV96_05165 [Bacillus altitudinis]PKQ84374.1 hypothetical protein CTV98_014985 [Bacillus altitudinis]RAU03642.1 hypothetical protein DEJ56_04795 [Bacillus altitudinis]